MQSTRFCMARSIVAPPWTTRNPAPGHIRQLPAAARTLTVSHSTGNAGQTLFAIWQQHVVIVSCHNPEHKNEVRLVARPAFQQGALRRPR